MKIGKLILVLLFCSLIISCQNEKEAKHNVLTDEEIAEGWELLFDGKTTNGWRNYGKSDISGWKIIDGELHNSGGSGDDGGDIVTEKDYDNFELYLEWKIAKESNSGIFFHVNEEAADAIYKSGPEYQLLDDVGWPTKLAPGQYSGANYAMHAPLGAKVKPLGEFNITRIIVTGPHVEHWLNGVKVVQYELWTEEWNENIQNCKWKDHPTYGIYKTGKIGLQDHGGLTIFRNIKIKPIKKLNNEK